MSDIRDFAQFVDAARLNMMSEPASKRTTMRDLVTPRRATDRCGAKPIIATRELLNVFGGMRHGSGAKSTMNGIGPENTRFQSANGAHVDWAKNNYGTDINLFGGHRRAMDLEEMRRNIRGNTRTCGRMTSP